MSVRPTARIGLFLFLCFCIVAGPVISEEGDGSFSFIAEDAAGND
jgi:hypothetical protein